MLTSHLFSRNIKTQNRFPIKWLNVTFNMIKVNLSASSSDSDSDTESSNKNKLFNEDGSTKTTNLKNADYLHAKKEGNKRKIAEQLRKLANEVSKTTNERKKEGILTNLFNTISLNSSGEEYVINKKPSKIKQLKSKQQKLRNIENQPEKRVEEEPSIIKQLKSKQKKLRNIENQPEKRVEEEPSIIKQLKSKQKKLRNIENQPEKRVEEEPSIIKQLKSKQKKLRNIENQPEKRVEEEPSIIKQLKSKQKKLRNIENQPEKRVEEEPSIIKQLKSKQKELRNIENQPEKRVEEEPSIIKQLKSKQKELRNIENQPEKRVEEEPSIIRQLKSKQKKLRNIENEPEKRVEEEPSIVKQLISKHQKLVEITKDQSKISGVKEHGPSIFWSLRNQQTTSALNNAEEECSEEYEPIFTNMEFTKVPFELKTMNMCEEYQLQMLMLRPPKNAFDESIKWTEEGKLWRFPIDNEQGLETEKDVHFSKHVFLDQHLVGWCPTKGPIRHFMELVCVGLSKNPYMTVQEKTDHIMWYKDYFGSKQDLLQKLGLVE